MAAIKELLRYVMELDERDTLRGFKKVEQAGESAAKGITSDLGKVEKEGGRIGEGTGRQLGKKLIAGFGALGVGAMLMKGIEDAVEENRGIRRLEGQFALTAEQAEEYGDLAGRLYRDGWGQGLEDVQQAVALTAERLNIDTQEELAKISAGVMAVSETWQVDFQEVIRATGQLMQNDLAPNAEGALDILTRAFQEGGDEAGDLLDTVAEYSQHWANVGLSGEEAMNQIIAGMEAGQRDADKTADAIKEMFIRVTDESKLTRESMEFLGLDAEEMRQKFLEGGEAGREAFIEILTRLEAAHGEVGATEASVGILGTQFEDMGKKAIDILLGVEGQLGEVDGALGDLTTTVADSEWETLKRDLEQGWTDALEGAADVANSALRRLAIDHAENQGNEVLAAWLSDLEFGYRDAAKFVSEFDLTLLESASTWEEARALTTAYVEEALGPVTEGTENLAPALDAVNQLVLAWNAEMGPAAQNTAKAERATEAFFSDLQAVNAAFDGVGGSAKDAGDDAVDALEEVEDQAEDTEDEVNAITEAFEGLRNEISEREDYLDLGDAFDDIKQSAEETWTAVSEGADDAEAKVRDHERATGRLKEEVISYAEQIEGLPPSVVTDLLALIDEGDYAEAERRLAALERTRTVGVQIKKIGDWWVDPSGLIRRRHSGGRVAAGDVIQPLSGEAFVADQPGRVLSRSQTAEAFDAGQEGGTTHITNLYIQAPTGEAALEHFREMLEQIEAREEGAI